MSDDKPTVAILGTGIMGTGVAQHLLEEGFDVTVWNRTTDKAEPLADAGATVALSPAAAVADADLVLTILFDAQAVKDVLAQTKGGWKEGAVLLQCATVGLEGTDEIKAAADEAGIALIEANMLGTKGPAETGKLRMLVSGDPTLVEKAKPVLDTMGSRTIIAGEKIGDATRLKVACNSWLGMLTAGVSQSMAMLQGWGLDKQLFIDAVAGTQSDSGYVPAKGGIILSDDYSANFMLDGLLKDLRLGLEQSVNMDTTVIKAVGDTFEKASKAGHGKEDIAAVFKAIAE